MIAMARCGVGTRSNTVSAGIDSPARRVSGTINGPVDVTNR
jgi:hypothetical protein